MLPYVRTSCRIVRLEVVDQDPSACNIFVVKTLVMGHWSAAHRSGDKTGEISEAGRKAAAGMKLEAITMERCH
jgi:hypothetical protein